MSSDPRETLCERLRERGPVAFMCLFGGFCLSEGGELWFQSSRMGRRPVCIWGRCLAHTFGSQTPAPPPSLPPAACPASPVQAERPHHPPRHPAATAPSWEKGDKWWGGWKGKQQPSVCLQKTKLFIFSPALVLNFKKNVLTQHLCSNRCWGAGGCACVSECVRVLLV